VAGEAITGGWLRRNRPLRQIPRNLRHIRRRKLLPLADACGVFALELRACLPASPKRTFSAASAAADQFA